MNLFRTIVGPLFVAFAMALAIAFIGIMIYEVLHVIG